MILLIYFVLLLMCNSLQGEQKQKYFLAQRILVNEKTTARKFLSLWRGHLRRRSSQGCRV